MNRFKKYLRSLWLAVLARPSGTFNALTEPVAEAKAAAPLRIATTTKAQLLAGGVVARPGDFHTANLGSLTMLYREVKKYFPPPMVVPSEARLATDKANDPLGLGYDDGSNFNGMSGWLNSNYCGIGFPGYAYLSELAQRSEYRAPSEAIADEATRAFIRFTTKDKGDKSDKIAKLEAAFKKYDVRQVIRKCLLHDLFFGRGQIFIDIDGQESDEKRGLPLVVDKNTIAKGSLKGFKNIEPIWTTPYWYNSVDPTQDDFYRPAAWYVLGRKVHHTRLMTMVSRPVPDMLKPSYNFGGISLTQLMEPYVIRWLKTVDSVNKIINNFSIIFLKTNMQAILQGNEVAGTGLLDRVHIFVQTRDNQGCMTLDKDSEDLGQVTVSLGGLSELQAQAQEHMAAPTRVPLVKLTGITPSGLNASSEGEITTWHENIGGVQKNSVEPVLDVVLDVIQLSEFGEIDENISYEFVPLVESTLKEIADIRKSDGDLAVAMITANVVDADEVREMLQANPDSGFTNLTGPAPTPKYGPNGEAVDEDGVPIPPPAEEGDDPKEKSGDAPPKKD